MICERRGTTRPRRRGRASAATQELIGTTRKLIVYSGEAKKQVAARKALSLAHKYVRCKGVPEGPLFVTALTNTYPKVTKSSVFLILLRLHEDTLCFQDGLRRLSDCYNSKMSGVQSVKNRVFSVFLMFLCL